MKNIYIEFDFKVKPIQPGTEILIAELGFAGFESFVENEEGVLAYIHKSEWNENLLDSIDILNSEEFEIGYTFKEIEEVNWNEEWERNFTPIEVDQRCFVRAPFHEKKDVEYEIVIEPKMSFGTGHHETTFMMLQFILEDDFAGKTVLDMGCGTAVLAILAEKRGAEHLDAIDIDSWCYENSLENIERNECKNIKVILGDASALEGRSYDVIIANINRNILLQDLPVYRKSLNPKGEMYLSGFYLEDLADIKKVSLDLGLSFLKNKERNNWVAAKFQAD